MLEKLYHYKGKVASVYDGDTVRVDIDLGCGIWLKNEPLRLYGINAPELRGEERPQGLISAEYLKKLIEKKEIFVETIKDKKGKYGRYIAIIWLKGEENKWINVNKKIVEDGYAVKKDYD